MEGSKNAFTHMRVSLKKLMGFTIEDRDQIDPVTKLSISQKSSLKSSWSSVSSKSNFGRRLMIRFLEIHPEHQTFFESMLSTNKDWRIALNKHTDRVVSALTCIVDSIDEPDILITTLQRTANSHHKLGVGQQEFRDLCNVLIQVLKEELEVDFTSESEEAWLVAMTTVCDVVASEMENMDNSS